MLDELYEFCQKYHILAFGIVAVVLGFLISVIFKGINIQWKWKK